MDITRVALYSLRGLAEVRLVLVSRHENNSGCSHKILTMLVWCFHVARFTGPSTAGDEGIAGEILCEWDRDMIKICSLPYRR